MAQPFSRKLSLSDQEFLWLAEEVRAIAANDRDYPKKIRSKNFYMKLSPALKKRVHEIVCSELKLGDLIWNFEVFWAYEAVGMHNDRNYFSDLNERCERGIIIPIEWRGLPPATKFYDLFFEEKVNWIGDGFATLDKRKIEFDPSHLHSPQLLNWQRQSIIVFDSRQIHAASEFAHELGDYKLSINGLGYTKAIGHV